jgi:hypothetical protein
MRHRTPGTPPDTTGTPPDTTGTPRHSAAAATSAGDVQLQFPGTRTSHAYTFTSAGDWSHLCLSTGCRHARHDPRASRRARLGSGQGGNRHQLAALFAGHGHGRVGGRVRWVNVSGDPDHTATRL